jgi:hypothetical protein
VAGRTLGRREVEETDVPADQLAALDATFLELEEDVEGALMHIGAALLLDPLPGVEVLWGRPASRCGHSAWGWWPMRS